jgi:hypothetical protein
LQVRQATTFGNPNARGRWLPGDDRIWKFFLTEPRNHGEENRKTWLPIQKTVSGWQLFDFGDGFESGSEPKVAGTYTAPLPAHTPRVGTRECPAVIKLPAAAFAILSELGKFHF